MKCKSGFKLKDGNCVRKKTKRISNNTNTTLIVIDAFIFFLITLILITNNVASILEMFNINIDLGVATLLLGVAVIISVGFGFYLIGTRRSLIK